MSTAYIVTCDRCGSVTRHFTDNKSDGDDKNQWNIDIRCHWLEDRDDNLSELKLEIETDYEVCRDCARTIAAAVRALMPTTPPTGGNHES